MKSRTPAFWATRVVLAAGFLAAAAAALVARALIDQACMGCVYPDVLGLPSNVVRAALAVGLAVVG